MPPLSMLNTGKQVHQFFDAYEVWNPQANLHEKRHRLKSIEQYSREHNTNEQPGKQYFKATSLPELINTAPLPQSKSARSAHELEKGRVTFWPMFNVKSKTQHTTEMNNRTAFIDFCQGLLNLNPVTRWTPQQARMHPFITGEKFTKPFVVSMLLAPILCSNQTKVFSARWAQPIPVSLECARSKETLWGFGPVAAERHKSVSGRGKLQSSPCPASSLYCSSSSCIAGGFHVPESLHHATTKSKPFGNGVVIFTDFRYRYACLSVAATCTVSFEPSSRAAQAGSAATLDRATQYGQHGLSESPARSRDEHQYAFKPKFAFFVLLPFRYPCKSKHHQSDGHDTPCISSCPCTVATHESRCDWRTECPHPCS